MRSGLLANCIRAASHLTAGPSAQQENRASLLLHRSYAKLMQANLLNPNDPSVNQGAVRITEYFDGGFAVNNIRVLGPIFAYQNMWTLWKVLGLESITKDSLAMLDLAAPKPEILVIGTGNTIRTLSPTVMRHLDSQGIAVMNLDTPNAMATFNFLNMEGRVVAAALLPFGTGLTDEAKQDISALYNISTDYNLQ